MALFVLGINHKTADVAVRERLAFAPDRLPEALVDCARHGGIHEVAILSTCNRTEIYLSGTDTGLEQCRSWLASWHGLDDANLQATLYTLAETSVVRHMMRVACGLESLVLGEPQILGQLKGAHAAARQAGTVRGELDKLFQATFSVAKKVRSRTAIGQNPVSVAYAAVSLAGRLFSDLRDSSVLLIGAGETIELVMKHLYRAGVREYIVANRNLERARLLAEQCKGAAITLSDIPEYLHRADVLVASTASPLPVIGKGMVEQALSRRRHRPMFMVDLAVPRDIESAVGKLRDAYVYTVDDLEGVIDENREARAAAAAQADGLIEQGAAEYMAQRRTRDSAGLLREFRAQAERLRQLELEKAIRRLQRGDEAEAVLRTLAHGLTNKLLHQPTVQVRRASAEGRLEVSEWLRDLYQLNAELGQAQTDSGEDTAGGLAEMTGSHRRTREAPAGRNSSGSS